MSGNNPYAVNGGYGGYRPSNESNPYAPTGTSNTVAGSRFVDPYVNQQNNASSASVNSFGSQERRRRSNPYDTRDIDGATPVPSARAGSGGGPPMGAYGGLPRPRYADAGPPPRNDYGYGRERDAQDYDQRQNTPPSFRERERAYNESQRAQNGSRSQERREIRERAQMPPPSTMPAPAKPSLPRLNEQQPTNGYTAPQPSYSPPENANRRYSPRRPTKGMEEIMRHIQSNWKDMEGDECVPVKVALRLEDPSSLGLADKEGDFSNTHTDLQKSLKAVVNEHYADFNSAVGTYHKIQNAINESQSRVRQLKLGLMNVKDGMLSARPEVKSLAVQSGELDDMLATLSNIESFKTIPAKLEEKISEKKFLGAVDLLMDSRKNITKTDLDGIGAITDLRNYFTNQESTLLDILIEELHDHLYLRSPYCKDRWKGKKANGDDRDPKDYMLSSGGNVWDRPFNHYLNNAVLETAMVEEPAKNPEADTFYYIHMILESLNKLGQLDEAVSRIEQRMPLELYKVVEKTNHDIDAKYPGQARGHLSKASRKIISVQANDGRTQVLSDFLWTLYSKFEAISESHRVLHEVIGGIAVREKVAKPETYTTGFKELWKLYQMEMRSILHDYLATDGENVSRSGLNSTATNDVFARPVRDKNKKMFRLSEMDQKSESMKAEEDELNEILKSSVPGLVSKSRTRDGSDLVSDRGGQDSTVAGHKLLIEPGVFNMTTLLPPSLTFLQRLKDIVPSTAHIPMSTLTSFLDDFLLNVFHPQLEEAVTELCAQAMIDLEAFSEDSQWSKHAVHPIFKGTASFMALIRAFSGMLDSIPQDQMFTQVIIDQLITYYDKCHGFYKALVSRVASPESNQNGGTSLSLKAAAAFASSGEVHDAALELLSCDKESNTSASKVVLVAKEVDALLSATKSSPLSAYDIISDPKSVNKLSLLHNSMQWLAAALTQIRHVEKSTHSGKASQARSVRRWTLVTSLNAPGSKRLSHPSGVIPVYLPLGTETALAFDQTVQSFRNLAQTSLLTLHVDIRCGIIHQLSRTLRGPEGVSSPASATDNRDSASAPALDSGLYPYVLASPPSSASPLILELNNDLIGFDSNIASYLPPKERSFILRGLSHLVDRYLIVAADSIAVMNTNGAERIRIDAMVVQQNLRAILANTADKRASWGGGDAAKSQDGLGISTDTNEDDEDDGLLTSSSHYFDLFLTGPDSILSFVRECKAQKKDVGYTYDELRTLVELCFSAKLRGEDREESVRARKGLQDALLGLGEGMWDSYNEIQLGGLPLSDEPAGKSPKKRRQSLADTSDLTSSSLSHKRCRRTPQILSSNSAETEAEMASYLSNLPSLGEFFPPTPRAAKLALDIFRLYIPVSIVQWTPLGKLQAMGKTSTTSRFNLPGRYAWAAAELVGPINMIYILMALPSKVRPQPDAPTSFLGTGLPAQHEILALLYLLHYLNRAIVSPFVLNPSMSPIHPFVTMFMTVFQYSNSTSIATWLVYSAAGTDTASRSIVSLGAILGILLFLLGLAGNIWTETRLYELRRGAAKRRAKSEGKAVITYDKIYVIPPAEGFFKHILYPHYVLEWVEWSGYWLLGGVWGLGWGSTSAAFWFLMCEFATMLPRAAIGRKWYEEKFGKRAVAGRPAAIPGPLKI
ncbi:exocyst subunit [Cladophialophora chaetospira]|uniref:Exocyst complex component Sec8 n=1 Tax=Cladophialophora chaetospira TaxID=386627 RepID=A0AA38XFM8_9EURO|nr:exocyst subunit [Cladophialophora chaetospira]